MYDPKKHWDKIGSVSEAGTEDDVGKFAVDSEGSSGYSLPAWSAPPQFWEFMQSGMRILDIGSGTGRQTGSMLERGIVACGCDISSGLLKVAKENLENHGVENPPLLQWDGGTLPFPDNTFDIVTTNTVLQHVTDDLSLDRIFQEVARVLRAGGVFISSETVYRTDLRIAQHTKVRSLRTYEGLGTKNGLRFSLPELAPQSYQSLVTLFNLTVRPNVVHSSSTQTQKEPGSSALPVSQATIKNTAKQIVKSISNILNSLVRILR
ncbi:MAG: class I SAM-dependent methyltransferase, partial [Anaerolineae bacterium]|nr:class I SAM-dependent methyltransferase [Anaerolineae bacterium]